MRISFRLTNTVTDSIVKDIFVWPTRHSYRLLTVLYDILLLLVTDVHKVQS